MNMIKVIDLVFKPGEKHDPEIADGFLKMIDDFGQYGNAKK